MTEKKRSDLSLKPPKNTPDIEKAKEEFLREAEYRKKGHTARPSPSSEKSNEAQFPRAWTDLFFSWPFFEPVHSFHPFVSAFFPWLPKPAKKEEPSLQVSSSQIVFQLAVIIDVLEMILEETGFQKLEKEFAEGKDIPPAQKAQLKLLEKFREIQKQVQEIS